MSVDDDRLSPGYELGDEARFVAEPPKRAGRTAFARDRARLLHSAALRRLAAKTQVMSPEESDFPRTRLTHSLECAQVGRELGAALGCDPDLVEVACLSHDLGHPPFGHNGEAALDEAAAAIGGFEGNAQSLRVLTRLEAKTFHYGRSVGLNLTRAALDASTKYPWTRSTEGDPSGTKFGVYQDDLPVFEWLRIGADGDRKCFEAQVMDWSDDVAYSVHDLEDAVQAGHLQLRDLRSDDRYHLLELASSWYAPDASAATLGAALDRLLALDYWPTTYDGTLKSLAGLKNLTSQLIGRFCSAAETATREQYGRGPLTRYQADLIIPDAPRHEVAVLKAVANRYVMQRAGADAFYSQQRELVRELVYALVVGAPVALDPAFQTSWRDAATDAERLRVVIDQVASLTDRSIVHWHRRLCR
ncbi:MAG: deoxyguanosinetriphosphate triphosphohydrolase [Actinomycetes bacterium]